MEKKKFNVVDADGIIVNYVSQPSQEQADARVKLVYGEGFKAVPNIPKSQTDRNRDRRELLREKGLTLVTDLWVHPDDVSHIRGMRDKLNKARGLDKI